MHGLPKRRRPIIAPVMRREPNRAGDCQRQPGAGRPPLLFELRCCATAELAAAIRGILCQCQYLQWGYWGATSRRRLSAKYTLATKMGAFSVSNYDGQSFMVSGKATTAAGGTQYSVPIAGGINGSFYGPMAAETGGNFNFHTTAGPTYLTSGIFAAKR